LGIAVSVVFGGQLPILSSYQHGGSAEIFTVLGFIAALHD